MAVKMKTSNTDTDINMALVRMYANLVNAGRRTLASVPAAYQDAVKAERKDG